MMKYLCMNVVQTLPLAQLEQVLGLYWMAWIAQKKPKSNILKSGEFGG
jgi:hypothetical protein